MEGIGIIFLGPPGSGKGTQAEKLEKSFGFRKISTGDILRDAVKRGTELGKLAQSFINRGELVPDEVMISLVEEVLRKTEGGFILDGFPRTLEQARSLDEMLTKLGREVKAVLFFNVPEDEIVKRLSSRRICPNCHAVYNLVTNPPKVAGKCDKCGVDLIIRDDDQPETVRRRIEVYRKDTKPVADYYRKKGILIEIDATGSPEEVFEKVKKALRL